MKVYLFQRKRSRVTHAVTTRKQSLGMYELDRLFGGGLYFYCSGKPGEGAGVLSACQMSNGHVTCKRCLAKMKRRKIKISKKPKHEAWPPEVVVEGRNPTCLGVPG